ncbi:MAG: hypothetical protein ABIM99_00570 [Candidatus Dojkabacteria bacterium]
MKKILLGLLIFGVIIGGYLLITGYYPGGKIYLFSLRDEVTSDIFYSKIGSLNNYSFGVVTGSIKLNDTTDVNAQISSLQESFNSNDVYINTRNQQFLTYTITLNQGRKNSNSQIKENITKLKKNPVVKELYLTAGNVTLTGDINSTVRAFEDTGLFNIFQEDIQTVY